MTKQLKSIESKTLCALICASLLLLITSFAVAEQPAAGAPKINYEQHIKPIFREHCLKCHNGNKQKGGLALDTYGATMEGGASGEVVYAEDVESSRLWALANHDEKPIMPPNGDRIADAKIALLKQWIEQGALETSGSKKSVVKKPDWAFQPVADDSGPGAMPENWLRQPVMTPARPAQIASLACSPRAPIVAISGHRQVSLYHTDSRELLGIAPFPEGMPYIIRFSRDGSLLMVGGGRAAHSGYVALYDVKTGGRLARVGDELDAVMTADIDASLQSIAIGDTNKLIKIFDIGAGERGKAKFEIKKHTDWVIAVSFSPDGKWLASADRAGGLVLWEAATGREHMVFDGHKLPITAISWRGDSRVFATSSEDGNVRVWSRDNKAAIKNWGAHGGGVTWVEFANNGDLLTTGRDKLAKLWDGDGKIKVTFVTLDEIGLRVAISANSKRVFMGDWAGTVKIADAHKREHIGALRSNPPRLELQLAAAQRLLKERLAAVDATTEKKKAADSEIIEATKKRNAATAQLAAVERKVQNLESQGTELRQQLKQLDEQLNKQRASVEPAKVAVNNTENGLKTVVAAIAQVVDQTRSEIAERDAQAQRCQQLEANQQAFAARSTQLAAAVADQEKRLAKLETQSAAIESKLAAVRKKVESAGEKVETVDQERERALSTEASDLDRQKRVVEQSLAATREEWAFFKSAYGK